LKSQSTQQCLKETFQKLQEELTHRNTSLHEDQSQGQVAENNALQSTNATLTAELDSARREIATMKGQLSQFKKENGTLRTEIMNFKREREQFQAKIQVSYNFMRVLFYSYNYSHLSGATGCTEGSRYEEHITSI